MPFNEVTIAERRLRFLPGREPHTRKAAWHGDAACDYEARERALAAWARRHGEDPEKPFECRVAPAWRPTPA